MNDEEKIKMFNDVFAPKAGEKVLFLVDLPHNDIKDNEKWVSLNSALMPLPGEGKWFFRMGTDPVIERLCAIINRSAIR